MPWHLAIVLVKGALIPIASDENGREFFISLHKLAISGGRTVCYFGGHVKTLDSIIAYVSASMGVNLLQGGHQWALM